MDPRLRGDDGLKVWRLLLPFLALPLAACGGSHLQELPPAPAYAPAPQAGAGTPYNPPAGSPYAPPQEGADTLPPGVTATGPRGTSLNAPDPERYDTVGYAGWYESPRLGIAHATLPIGTAVEVTALDTGKTVLLSVTEQMGATDKVIGLSSATAQLLGATDMGALPVRVRRVTPSPMDQNALANGQPASVRPDTPPVLLTPLRNRLPKNAATVAPPPAPSRRPVPSAPGASYAQPGAPARSAPRIEPRPEPRPAARPAAAGPGLYVQVATLSSRPNADRLAAKLGARVSAAGRLWRVRLGPFANAGEASRARDAAARRGYGDARILRED